MKVIILAGGLPSTLIEEDEKDAKTDGRDWRSADALAHYETVCALWIQ